MYRETLNAAAARPAAAGAPPLAYTGVDPHAAVVALAHARPPAARWRDGFRVGGVA